MSTGGRRVPWGRPASDRRREVARRLVELGLARGGRRSARAPLVQGELGVRLRDACLELGPAFAAYGRYLASRADLLAPLDCLALAEIPDVGEPVPAAAVRRLLEEELGRPEELFASFEEAPLASGLLFQWHRATALDGEPVVVKVVRPDLDRRLGGDAELLELLQPPGWPLDGAAADHRGALAATLDLEAEARGLRALADEAWDGAPLAVARILPELSSARVLTARWPAGAGLGTLAGGRGAATVARRLAFVWLRQALLGRAVPVEPGPANVLVPPSGGIAFLGGPLVSPPATDQGAFLDLLVAVASEEPEAACAVLLRESEASPEAVDRETLLLRLRQVVPFRDGAWSAAGLGLPELLCGYWRTVRESGYRPRGPLLDLLRGLLAVAATGRRLDPEGDPVREALRDVRLEAGFERLRDGFGGGAASSLAPYAAFLTQFPRKLDELLTLAAEGETHLKLHLTEVAERKRRADAWVAVVALAVALVVVAVVVPRLPALAPAGAWGERIVVAVVAVLGIGLLRAAGRGS